MVLFGFFAELSLEVGLRADLQADGAAGIGPTVTSYTGSGSSSSQTSLGYSNRVTSNTFRGLFEANGLYATSLQCNRIARMRLTTRTSTSMFEWFLVF